MEPDRGVVPVLTKIKQAQERATLVTDLDAAHDSEVTGAIDRLLTLREYQRRPEAQAANDPLAATDPEYRELRLAS